MEAKKMPAPDKRRETGSRLIRRRSAIATPNYIIAIYAARTK
jgi:hypothetical protein